MNATTLSFASHANALAPGLSLTDVRARAPAVFATEADARLSPTYTFIPTSRVLNGLMQAGFVPVDARQTRARRGSPVHARHVVRLRRRFEHVHVGQTQMEVVFLNSHDGTSAYQLRVGLFRVVCANGLIVSKGAFPATHVPHRGEVVDDVVAAALQTAEQFPAVAARVERMQAVRLPKDEQIRFAERALALKYPDLSQSGMQPSQLLTCRRIEDTGDDLFTVLNVIEENLIRGGLSRRAASGRLVRTRPVQAIRDDLRIHGRLWELAEEVLAAA